jgi:hypothetical protein
MEFLKLQPETVIALNNFLQIWKQDPASQNHLDISPQNIILWSDKEPEKVIDLNPIIEAPVEFNIDEFLQLEEIQPSLIETPLNEVPTELESNNTNHLTQIINDLKQTPEPTTRSITNPFSGGTWKEQVNRILKFLSNPGRTRHNLNKKIEAYYYLGQIISKSNNPSEIKDLIQNAQVTRRAKDTWKGALRIYEVLELRPKEITLQLKYVTATHIIKLLDDEYTQLLESIRT